MVMIIGLLFLVLLSVSFASANENVTEIAQNDNEDVMDEAIAEDIEANPTNEDIQQTDEIIGTSENQYNAIISAEDFTATYNSGKSINVKVKDLNGTPIEYAIVKIVYSKSKNEDMDLTNANGICAFKVRESVANQYATISLDDAYYSAAPITINIKIITAKISVKKIVSDTRSYFTLKAVVKDSNGRYIKEGYVKFTINGKKYNVKVKNGVASKKIKMKKAKTYRYKATFSSKHYKSKTATSKAYVKKYQKYHYFKAGKYTGKLTHKQYMRLVKAKINGKNAQYYNIRTGKYYYTKMPVYKTVKVIKTKWVYKKVLSYEAFYYDDGTIDSYDYDLTRYYDNGWKYYGSYSKEFIDGYEHYVKLKKKVKYTTTKEVRSGYKTEKSPILMIISTSNGNSQYGKGDRIEVWSSLYWYDHEKPICVKRINL